MASPVSHVSSKSPPTLIIHGTIDTTVDRAQSEELSAILAKNGVEHRLIMLPNVGHTFDLQSWQHKPLPEDLRTVVAEFFGRYLRKPRIRPVEE
jgi:dipeptidyl aminopeptidase/acylaminoacyl peptidase